MNDFVERMLWSLKMTDGNSFQT